MLPTPFIESRTRDAVFRRDSWLEARHIVRDVFAAVNTLVPKHIAANFKARKRLRIEYVTIVLIN